MQRKPVRNFEALQFAGYSFCETWKKGLAWYHYYPRHFFAMPNPKYARWIFTVNNPTDDDDQQIGDFLGSDKIVYATFGREVGSSGTPHYQGYLILRNACRRSHLSHNLCSRAFLEPARGNSQQCRDYCQKDGDFEEFGRFPGKQGKRSELNEFWGWCEEFYTEYGRGPSARDVAMHFPTIHCKFPRVMDTIALKWPTVPTQEGEMKPWQRELFDAFDEAYDDRSIRFIVDAEGGNGKTWFARYCLTHRNDVQVLDIGKRSDLAHIIDETKTVFIFNVPRDSLQYISYSLLESIKDRMLISTKYSGRLKVWTETTHVLVLTNEHPDMNKLTADRYWVHEIS